ncbi:hypothetical protein KKF91_20465 [Myxococcota bacterium]|nr:hypothetical protein [Myxococcota bacterium]MBU1432920.1 hypothetical protein [Myxococcota bacterium]MBU1899674.1 hypothetical protein [Myxococcota bacterium]
MSRGRGVILALLCCGVAQARPSGGDAFQIGLYAGGVPSEPLSTQLLGGGWLALALNDHWRVEASGAYAEGLSRRTALYDFLSSGGLLAKDEPLADALRFTAEGWIKVEPLRGKVALLQATLGGYRQAFGLGLGGRWRANAAGEGYVAPAVAAATSLDLLLGAAALLRFEARALAERRRDASISLGAELLLGVGWRR